MSDYPQEPTAAVPTMVLAVAAGAGYQHWIAKITEQDDIIETAKAVRQAEYDALGWWDRLLTLDPEERMFDKVHDLQRMRRGMWRKRDRCFALMNMAKTCNVSDIRLPERDITLLRDFLDGIQEETSVQA